MKEPTGAQLLETLIKLLAEQNGVHIKCEVVTNERTDL